MTIGVIGEVMIELSAQADQAFRKNVAGDTFNAAVMMSRLGVSARYVTALGDDVFSKEILDTLKAHNFEPNCVLKVSDARPGLYVISNDEMGERQFTYWRDNSAAKRALSNPRLFKILLQSLEGVQSVFWSGITLALMSKETREHWFGWLKEFRAKGREVFFDSNYRAQLWVGESSVDAYTKAMNLCDHLLPSSEDIIEIFALDGESDVYSVLDSLSCQRIILTAYGKACVWVDKIRQSDIELPFISRVVDATGAGDAFSGAYVAATVENKSYEQAISIAHQQASRVVQVKGAILPFDQSKLEKNQSVSQ